MIYTVAMNAFYDCDYGHTDAEFAEMWQLLNETNGRTGRHRAAGLCWRSRRAP